MKHTVIIKAYSEHGVLYRIVDLFLRRKVHIIKLSMIASGKPEVVEFTIIVDSDKETLEKIVKQLQRIIEVTHAAIK